MSRVARLVARLAWLVMTLTLSLALVLAPARAARADEALLAPNDVPLVPNAVHAGSIPLPALPASYQVQRLGWWTVSYPAAVRERVQPLIDHADEWKAQLAADFGQEVLSQPIEVRIGRTWAEMSALVPHELGVPAYAAGVTYGPLRLVLLSLTEPTGGESTDLPTVFHHELSHVALDDATRGRHVPRWFNEGLAIYESGEHPIQRMRALWDATLFHQLLPLADLDRGFPERQDQVNVAYAESADVVRFFLRGKDQRFVSLLERVRDGSTFERALGDAYGTDVRRLEYQWREEASKRNTFAPLLASGSFIWVLAFAALLLGFRRRRRQTQETLARWEREEALEALARAPAVADEASPFTDPARVHVSLPRVEHDGGWHTLH